MQSRIRKLKIKVSDNNEKRRPFRPPKVGDFIDNTAYFKNGFLYDVCPRDTNISLYEDRGVAYNARFIISDGVKYDLTSYEDLGKIETPDFQGSYDTTSSLDYVLRMCASNYRNKGQNHLSISILAIATKMMIYSKISWSSKDFKRIVYWLIEDGRQEEADDWEKFIDHSELVLNKTDLSRVAKKQYDELIQNYDLVAFISLSPIICETCAKYSGRIFSTRNNSPFAPLPDIFHESTLFHTICNSQLVPYYGQAIYYKGKEISSDERMYGSYLDTRTEIEKDAYEKRRKQYEEAKKAEMEKEKSYRLYLSDKAEYNALKARGIRDLPKSTAEYIRQKYSKK